MAQPTTQFAKAGDVHIAYQVIGDGPVDLVWAYGLASNIEVFWQEPSLAAFLRRLAEFSRLIIFDRRGCGLSDRGGPLTTPTMEERAEDILVVLDAVASERASIFGVSEGGGLAAAFASMFPERTTSIVVYGTAIPAKGLVHPLGLHEPVKAFEWAEFLARGWGTREGAEVAVPIWASSMTGDASFTEWIGQYTRHSVSRNEIRPLVMNTFSYDLVDVFPTVRVPALVIGRREDPLAPAEYLRHIAALIPDAHFVELDGVDHLPFVGDAESIAAEIEEFLVGSRRGGERRRRLLTLLNVSAVAHGRRLATLGDHGWRELLAALDGDIDAHLARFAGERVKHSGDGVLAAFDGPARAIRCALGIVDSADRRGLQVKVGVHTGECEVVDGAVLGVAVQTCERLAGVAHLGEILTSSTVRDLVAGSGVRFGNHRDVELPGASERRSAFSVLRRGVTPDAARRMAIEQENVFRLDGDYWTVGYRGLVVSIRDSKGLRDIGRMVAEPNREFHALHLAAEGGNEPPRAAMATVDVGAAITVDPQSPREPLIDEAARSEYRRRITELEEDIDDAALRGDDERLAAAREELDCLMDALSSAYGLGGRVRRVSGDAERARKAVTRRVRAAMKCLDEVHPPLSSHLHASIRTGLFCAYTPERPVEWSVDAG